MGGMIKVRGARPLYGTVRVPAAKNSVLPLLAASLLCGGPVRLRGAPRLSDVEGCLALLRAAGCAAGWDGGDVVVSGQPSCCRLPGGEAGRMRASVLFAAPLLARLGRAETVLPGGCRIGSRPVDWHLAALEAMGAEAAFAGQRLILTAPAGLHGAAVRLPGPSVGATETVLLAGCAARGRTVLQNAAKEPEIADLARFLNGCGAAIRGAGSGEIVIEGRAGRPLRGASYAPMPDRICASTLVCAAAAARGCVTAAGCAPGLYAPVLDILEQAGCRVLRGADSVTIGCAGPLRGVGRLVTGGYPALATDAAPLVAAALLTARGQTVIEDRVFEARFGCAGGFAALGAHVRVEAGGRELWIEGTGGRPLRGAALAAGDLRGGAALAVAALAAEGESRITGCGYIDRGYPGLEAMLAAVGAQICREMPPQALD